MASQKRVQNCLLQVVQLWPQKWIKQPLFWRKNREIRKVFYNQIMVIAKQTGQMFHILTFTKLEQNRLSVSKKR